MASNRSQQSPMSNGHENVYGRPNAMSMMEWMAQQMGFELIKDGSRNPTDVDWLDRPTQFTRIYKGELDILGITGEKTTVYFKFIYDQRRRSVELQISKDALNVLQDSNQAKEDAALQEIANRMKGSEVSPK